MIQGTSTEEHIPRITARAIVVAMHYIQFEPHAGSIPVE